MEDRGRRGRAGTEGAKGGGEEYKREVHQKMGTRKKTLIVGGKTLPRNYTRSVKIKPGMSVRGRHIVTKPIFQRVSLE